MNTGGFTPAIYSAMAAIDMLFIGELSKKNPPRNQESLERLQLLEERLQALGLYSGGVLNEDGKPSENLTLISYYKEFGHGDNLRCLMSVQAVGEKWQILKITTFNTKSELLPPTKEIVWD